MGILLRHQISPEDWLKRQPERLVLEGYRYWICGTVLRSTDPWTDAQLLYRDLLGNDDGAEAIVALAGFTKTLGQCALCPLNVFRAGSPHICRDESLVMGLIAGFQNADKDTVHLCMDALCCPSRSDRVAVAAARFALTLKRMDQVLLPIPAKIVRRIAARTGTGPLANHISGTIH